MILNFILLSIILASDDRNSVGIKKKWKMKPFNENLFCY